MKWSVSPVSGTLEHRNASPGEARERLVIAEPTEVDAAVVAGGWYLDRAIQGATLAPRPFWFVTPVAPARERTILMRTDPEQARRAKDPWKGLELEGEIESDFFFATNLEIAPYRIGPMKLCALPISVETGRVELLAPRDVLRRGGAGFHEWLERGDAIWKERRKESDAQDVELYQYLNNHANLTRQHVPGSVRLVYGGKGTHVRAVVIDPAAQVKVYSTATGIDVHGLIFDMNLYYITCRSADEAHYLAAILNTPYIDEGIKETQTQGAWGARDIHRRPFEMFPIPEYDSHEAHHQRLAVISREAHERVALAPPARTFAAQLAPVSDLVAEAGALVQQLCEHW
jgi:hypothetical protein